MATTQSPAFGFVKLQWMFGNVDEAGLSKIVANGYITEAEKVEILATPKFQ
ncbi:hypothetical protein PBC5_030 [Bacillus phage PBC5]|nr:hypothetical protein PBC5_030 [Bacillus phage PBC5]